MSMSDRFSRLTTRRFGVEVQNGVNGGYNVFYAGLTKIGARRVATNLTKHSADCTARINAGSNVVNGSYPPAKATLYRAAEYDSKSHTWKAI